MSSFSLTSAASNGRSWDQHVVAAGHSSSDAIGGNDFVVQDNEEGRKDFRVEYLFAMRAKLLKTEMLFNCM